MSLRDRFRPAQDPFLSPAADKAKAEARAAQTLAASRGKASIPGAPSAGKSITALVKPLLKQTGMGINELKRHWADLAGSSFARATPERLANGVLTLQVPGALAPFLQQQTPLLIERLKLAGVKVKSIRLEQRSAAPRTANITPVKRPLSASEETALAQALDPVGDAGLKSALMRLGRAVKQG